MSALVPSADANAAEPPLAAPRGRAEWKSDWDRFTPLEGAMTLGLTAGGFMLERRLADPTYAVLGGAIPGFDDSARWLLRGRDAQTQVTFERLSDLGFRAMTLFPYVVDAGIVALGVHRNPDLAAQLFLIDVQSLTLSGITQLVTSRLLGRARPYEHECEGPGSKTTSRTCTETPDYKGFYSGHTAAAFTSAGLVCVHHQHIPLYGGGAPDAWACTWALTVATATGLLRIGTDAHWASDVVVGAGIGWFYGYMVPKWLHYGTKRARAAGTARLGAPSDERPSPLQVVWTPSFVPVHDGGVVGIGGTF